jgi:hypothetical protein
VCGTDVHLHHGRLAGVPYPLIPGHVTAGTLAAVRGDLRDVHGVPLREGDVVTFLDVHRTCHACWYCLVAKASTRCPSRKVYGITYGAADGLCGGWADYLHLLAGTRVIRLENATPRDFLLGGCSLPTALHALERAQVQIGDAVLVLGIGPVGLACVALARAAGAGQVLAIGGPANRTAAALAMGADAVLDFATLAPADRQAWVRERTGGRGRRRRDRSDRAHPRPWCRRCAGRAMRGAWSSSGSTRTTARSPGIPTSTSTRSTSTCAAAGAATTRTSIARCRSPAMRRLGAPWRSLPVREFRLAEAAQALAAVASGEGDQGADPALSAQSSRRSSTPACGSRPVPA